MKAVRSFIAIECPTRIKEEVQKVQQELKIATQKIQGTDPSTTGPSEIAAAQYRRKGGQDISGIHWVRPTGIHITLKFLGNVPENQLGQLVETVGHVLRPISSFVVKVGGMGVFPNKRSPRVLWVGVQSEGDELIRLYREIEEGLSPLGFSREDKAFDPHLTLGRLRSDGRNRLRQSGFRSFREVLSKWVVENQERKYGEFEVNEVVLMKSDLQTGGAVYTQLATMELAAA